MDQGERVHPRGHGKHRRVLETNLQPLEMEEITTLVVNAQHFKAVAGRKTDLKDAEWLADLLRHRLLQGSYIPDREQRELRELVRYRKSLINERAREVNRLQKVLEGANIKLSSVASNVLGVSGRSMIEAIIHGIDDPKFLAGLARGRMKSKKRTVRKSSYRFNRPPPEDAFGRHLRTYRLFRPANRSFGPGDRGADAPF